MRKNYPYINVKYTLYAYTQTLASVSEHQYKDINAVKMSHINRNTVKRVCCSFERKIKVNLLWKQLVQKF
jgi:hypothetical protein